MGSTNREARFKRLLQDKNRQIRELTEKLGEAVEYLEALPDLDAITAENEQLRQAMTEGAYRAAWEEVAEAAGIDPEYFDDLWQLAPPEMDPEKDPDPKALKAHLAESVKGRKVYLQARDDQAGDEDDRDEQEGDDQDGDPFGFFKNEIDEDGDPAVGKPSRPPASRRAEGASAKPARQLQPGEGVRRGGRDAAPNRDPFAIIDADFAATGRTDAFKL